ncbi:MAG: GNAT family N-acetyltransferase [Anaerolineales bacterium]|nr:MAG: GNAT family N-acetyltransferase [Anaerolineales bacterium]
MDSIRIERIPLKDLPKKAARYAERAPRGAFIPITPHRAIAMSYNPHAEPEDVALLLALQGERPVGYFGLMAVQLAHAGQLHRMHWLTTWAVSKDMLGKGLGSQLMQAALDLDVDLAIVGSAPARRVSAKFGFQEVAPMEYVRINFDVLGRYNPINLLLRGLRKLAALLGKPVRIEPLMAFFHSVFEFLIGWLLRPVFYLIAALGLWQLPLRKKFEPPMEFVVAPAAGTGFYRDAAVLNWMLEHRWVTPWQSETAWKDYEFTDWRSGFEIFGVGTAQEYALLQFSKIRGRGVLKVLDSTLPPGRLLSTALWAAVRRGARIIEGPAELAKPLNPLARLLMLLRLQRTLQLHPRASNSPLAKAIASGEFTQHYTDGDMVFT